MIPPQYKLLLADLVRAEEAGLLVSEGTRPAWPNVRVFYINKSTVDLTVNKRTALEKYLKITYPDVDVTVNRRGAVGGGESVYIQVY